MKQPISKVLDSNLPTIGILVFEGVIMNEVIAPMDVFSKTTANGEKLFNVITIAKTIQTYNSAQGLKIIPDISIDQVPKLEVLVVPSSYHPNQQTEDKALVQFIQKQHQSVNYMASHCAGAFLIGAAGVADHKNIVTYVSGGESLKANYPTLKVANDRTISVMTDGKLISSNGNLVSYLASLDLLEKMTSPQQRAHVEEALLIDRLCQN
ncbi:DJ-1/PfpI family protein [Aureispira anguillae]|nr:DJ-1/PfpI family protein [Aureispira anguillae]